MARTVAYLRSRLSAGLLATLIGLALVAGSAPVAAVGVIAGPTSGLPLGPGLRAELAIDPTLPIGIPDGLTAGLTPAPAAAAAAAPPARPPVAVRKPRAYAGSNHVWSAALGLDRSVAWFSCSRSRPPGMAVYRWGCAGTNNVYLFAHAGGPFRRLHDLYVRGGLRRGLTVTYADGDGRIHRYAVAWWRVVLPTDGDFAIAAQSRPSMTLQTCVGLHSRYRLVVRLYETGGPG
jgi:hypothetical protein